MNGRRYDRFRFGPAWLAAMATVLFLGTGCAGLLDRLHGDDEVYVEPLPPAPPPEILAIRQATSPTATLGAVRGYLNMVKSTRLQPIHVLREQVSQALADNPFPPVQRVRADLLDRFFDMHWAVLEPAPASFADVDTYIEKLRDARLAAEASGDEQRMVAIDKRLIGCRVVKRVNDELGLNE